MQLQLTVAPTLASPNDGAVAWFTPLASRPTLGTLSLRTDRMATALGSTFTTTVRVIDRVHCGTANVRTSSEPTSPSRLAQADIHMIAVSYLTDRGSAETGNATHFTTGQ